jgi:hypothetical protein
MSSPRDRWDALRRIPLEAVLEQTGASRDRYDKTKWHTVKGVISITGMKFMNWNHAAGGGGAIDLVMHLTGAGFKDAVDWLGRHFPLQPSFSSPPPPPRILKLPPPHPHHLSAVKRYLINDRAITPSVVDSLIASGLLYADHRANAVFLLLGNENVPVGAELRGTGSAQWRGMAPGSQKERGFFAVPAPDVINSVILTESAIDAISCALLHPSAFCISTSGARPNPLWLPSLLSHTCFIYCGFDSDPTGDAMAMEMIRIHPTVLRLRPTLHDWNDVLRSAT